MSFHTPRGFTPVMQDYSLDHQIVLVSSRKDSLGTVFCVCITDRHKRNSLGTFIYGDQEAPWLLYYKHLDAVRADSSFYVQSLNGQRRLGHEQ